MSENQKLISQLCQQLHKYKQAVIPGTGVAVKDGDLVFIPPGEIHLDRLESQVHCCNNYYNNLLQINLHTPRTKKLYWDIYIGILFTSKATQSPSPLK